MQDSPRRFVVDANVLFDLHAGGILTIGIRAIDAWVPDFVLRQECKEPTVSQLRGAGVREGSFSPVEVHDMTVLRRDHEKLSVGDASVFVLGRREGCAILTRDEPLATLAAEHGIPVAGTLDLLDLLVQENHLRGPRAADAVEKMLGETRGISRERAKESLNDWGVR